MLYFKVAHIAGNFVDDNIVVGNRQRYVVGDFMDALGIQNKFLEKCR